MQSLMWRLVRRAFRGLGPVAPGVMGRLAFWLWFRPHRARSSRESQEVFARADRHCLAVGRKRVAVYGWGAGEPVLIVHGWSSRATQLSAFVPPLEQSGFKVLAFDAPAHGRSSGSATNVWKMADALGKLEVRYGPFGAIITHSMGALATATAVAAGELRAKCAVCLSPALRQANFVDGFARIVGLPDPVVVDLRRRLDAWADPDLWDGAVIPFPTLLVHDTADEFIPMADVLPLERNWPAAELVTTHGLGHSGILKDAQVVDTTMAFVRRHACADAHGNARPGRPTSSDAGGAA